MQRMKSEEGAVREARMSYGPDGLAPKNLSTGYADGAVGHSVLAAAGVLAVLLTIPIGVIVVVEGNLLQGLSWVAGGILVAVTLFRLAAQRNRKTDRHPSYALSLASMILLSTLP